MGNPVTWFELIGPDPEQATKFYAELFGWHTQVMPEVNYTLVDTHAGRGINGGIGPAQAGQPASVKFYAEDPDIQTLLDRAESLGGKTIVPVTETPMVTFAVFSDLDGNAIGLVKSDESGEGGGVSEGDGVPVDWVEVLTPDPKRAWKFYTDLFGWSVEDVSGEGFVYGQFDTGAGRGARGGIGGSPDGKARVNVYAGVDDLHKYIERAESLGAKTLMPPMEVTKQTSVAMFQDPQGTWLGLYRMQP